MRTISQLNNEGVVLTRDGEYEQARKRFDRAIALDGDNPFLYMNRGLAAQQSGDSAAAAEDFERAIALKDDLYEAFGALGLTCYEGGDWVRAEECYLKALSGERTAETLNNMGVLRFNQERYEEARRYFEEAIKLRPSFDAAQYNLWDVCHELGDENTALTSETRR